MMIKFMNKLSVVVFTFMPLWFIPLFYEIYEFQYKLDNILFGILLWFFVVLFWWVDSSEGKREVRYLPKIISDFLFHTTAEKLYSERDYRKLQQIIQEKDRKINEMSETICQLSIELSRGK